MTATASSSSVRDAGHDAPDRLRDAERRLLAEYHIEAHSRRLLLSDPALAVRLLETGAGEPLVLLHGSGMSAATWTPLLPHCRTGASLRSISRASALRAKADAIKGGAYEHAQVKTLRDAVHKATVSTAVA